MSKNEKKNQHYVPKCYLRNFTDGDKYIATIIPAHPNDWAEFDMYYSTMKTIEQKIKNGEWVTEEEYEFYEDVDGYLKEICDNNFSAYPCVVIDNEAFELEDYKF